jgi:hypothetical protein
MNVSEEKVEVLKSGFFKDGGADSARLGFIYLSLLPKH